MSTHTDAAPAGAALVDSHVIPPKGGWAAVVKAGQYLRIVDVEGQQVADMVAFNANDFNEPLSVTYTRTRVAPDEPGVHYHRDSVGAGTILLSTQCRPLMTMIRETQEPAGVHCVSARQCNRFLYESHGIDMDGCQEILERALEPYGIIGDHIPDTFNLHMNYRHDPERGRWYIEAPVSRAGDYADFRAEIDVLVAISNCPCDVLVPCNGDACTPLRVEIYEGDPAS